MARNKSKGKTKAQRESDLLSRVKLNYKQSRDHLSDWRREAKELYRFRAGEQWEEAVEQEMRSLGRPMVTFNQFDTLIDAVLGFEINNRQSIKYIPREQGDIDVNEVLSGAADWVRDQCQAEHEELDMFADMLVTGIGWSQTFVEYIEDLDGKICSERRDPLRMFYDPNAKKKNLKDRKWNLYIADMLFSEVEETWPDKADEVLGAKGVWDADIDDLRSDTLHDDPVDQYRGNDSDVRPKPTDIVRVAHYEEIKLKPVVRLASPEGDIQTLTKEQWDANKEQLTEQYASAGLDINQFKVEQKKRAVNQVFIIGDTVLEMSDSPVEGSFTYNPITGKRDTVGNVWYGLGRALKQPQQWSNKFYSTILEIIAKNSKGGMMVEEDAFLDAKRAERDWARPDKFVVLQSGAIGRQKVSPKPPAEYPQGVDRLMELSKEAFFDVTGINLELMGLTNRTQPGVTESQRIQSGINTLSWAFEALSQYRTCQGELLAHFIINFIADGRLIRIVGERHEQFVPLVREDLVTKFDVVVDESPSAPNVKQKTWGTLETILPIFAQMQIPIPPEVTEYLPVPASLGRAWKQLLQPPELTPEQQEQQQKEQERQTIREEFIDRLIAAEADEKQASANEKKSKEALNLEKARTEAADRNVDAASVQIDQQNANVSALEQQMNALQGQQDASIKAREVQSNIVNNAANVADNATRNR